MTTRYKYAFGVRLDPKSQQQHRIQRVPHGIERYHAVHIGGPYYVGEKAVPAWGATHGFWLAVNTRVLPNKTRLTGLIHGQALNDLSAHQVSRVLR